MRRRLEDPRLFAVLAVALVIVVWWPFRRFTVDDAFIAYRHASNLARGFGPVMNPGQRVEGVSNLPWTVLLGACARLGIAPHLAGPLFSMLCGWACIPAVALLGRAWTGDRRVAAAAAVLCAVGLPLAIWSASGMETPAVALALTGLAVSIARARVAGVRWTGTGACIALGVLATLRPEGAMYALPLALAVWRLDPVVRRRFVRSLWVTAVLVLPVVVFRRAYYGDWFPNPVYAKAPFGWAGLAPGLAYVLLVVLAWPLAFLPLVDLVRRARVDPVAVLVVAVVLEQLAFVAAVGGDHFPGYRFAAPIWPLLAVVMARRFALVPAADESGALGGQGGGPQDRGAWSGGPPGGWSWGLVGAAAAVGLLVLAAPRLLEPLAEWVASTQRLQRPAATHAARLQLEVRHAGAVLLAVAAWGAWHAVGRLPVAARAWGASLGLLALCTVAPAALDPRIRTAREPDAASRYGRMVGLWLGAHLPPGSLVATNAAGALPYFSDLPVVDMLGLTDRRIARRRPDAHQWIGHERGDGAAVLARRPAVIVFGGPEGSIEPWPFRSDQEVAADPRFHADYQLERVPLNGFDFTFYRRHDVVFSHVPAAGGL